MKPETFNTMTAANVHATLDRAANLAGAAEEHLIAGGDTSDPIITEAVEAMRECVEALQAYSLPLGGSR